MACYFFILTLNRMNRWCSLTLIDPSESVSVYVCVCVPACTCDPIVNDIALQTVLNIELQVFQ